MQHMCNTIATETERKIDSEKDLDQEEKKKNAPVKIKKYLDILRAYDNNNNYNKNDNIIIIKIITIKNANSVLVINVLVALKKRYIDFWKCVKISILHYFNEAYAVWNKDKIICIIIIINITIKNTITNKAFYALSRDVKMCYGHL